MRQDRFTLDNLMNYIYNEQISKIPAKLYNDDAQVKYLDFGSLYTYCCHGSKEHQIRRWLRERIAYVDSMMGYFTSQEDQVTIRMNKTGYVSFDITPYIPLYLSVKWSNASNGTQTIKVGRGETATFYYNSTTATDQEILIPYAKHIKKLDNLSNLNPSSCILSNAVKLTNVEIHSSELYNINVTNNKFLRRIDLQDCTALGTVTATGSSLDLSNCKYLQYCNTYNTNLTEIQLNTSGGSLIEIYYPKTIQSIQLIKQRLLETIGLPYGENGDEIPTSLYTIDIQECPSIVKLNTSNDETIYKSFVSMVYCNNLTLRNSLDLKELSFDIFHRLTKVTIENMYNLELISFNNLLPKGNASTIKYIGMSNCPLLTEIELNCTSNDYEITFATDSILNLGKLTSLKNITSNCIIKGLKTIVTPLSLESMYFTNEYGEGYSTIKNIWSSSVCTVNTDGATAKATHVDKTYVGIDFKDMNLKNIDLSALVNIPSAINFSLSPTTVNPNFNLNRDGIDYPYLQPIGTLDLSNYTKSLAKFFNGVDLDKLEIICNNDLPQTDLSYCFYNSTFSSLDSIKTLLSRISVVNNLDYCFYKTRIDSIEDVLAQVTWSNHSTMNYMFAECPNIKTLGALTVPSSVTQAKGMFSGCPLISVIGTINAKIIDSMFENCNRLKTVDLTLNNTTSMSAMFKNCVLLEEDIIIPSTVTKVNEGFYNCLLMTKIHSNWNNNYNNEIVATDCYKRCNSINNIDGIALELNDYTFGLEHVPAEWGGYNFLREYTGIYKVSIPSDNFTFNFYFAGGDATNHSFDDGLTSWGDGKVDSLVMSHTYERAGDYYIKTKLFLGAYAKNVSPDFKSYMTEVIQYPTNMGNIVFDGCTRVTSINVSGCINTTFITKAFNGCSALTTIIGAKDIFNSNITSTLSCFQGCSSLTSLDLSNIDVSGVTDMSNMFYGCKSLTELNIDNWNTSQVTKMNDMFSGCSLLTSIDLSSCNVSSLQYAIALFFGCTSLLSINLSGWEVAPLKDINSMFNNCTSLPSVEVNHLNTSNVVSFYRTFANTESLTTLDISNWDLSNVTNMDSMFYKSSVTTINYPTMEAPKLTLAGAFASNCPNLTNVYVNMPSTITKVERMIENTPNIEDFGVINLDGLNNLKPWVHLNPYNNPVNKPEIRFRFKGTLTKDYLGTFYDLFIYGGGYKFLYDRFSKQTLIDLINCLYDYSGTETVATLNLGSTNLAKLTEDEILAASNKNWTLT